MSNSRLPYVCLTAQRVVPYFVRDGFQRWVQTDLARVPCLSQGSCVLSAQTVCSESKNLTYTEALSRWQVCNFWWNAAKPTPRVPVVPQIYWILFCYGCLLSGRRRAHRCKTARRYWSIHGVDESKWFEGAWNTDESPRFLSKNDPEVPGKIRCPLCLEVAFEMLDVNKEGVLGKKQAPTTWKCIIFRNQTEPSWN